MEQLFKQHEMQIDEEKRNQALTNIRVAVDQKTYYYIPSVWRLFLDQIRFISVQYWILQFGFMLLASFILHMLNLFQTELYGLLNTITILASAVGVIGAHELNKNIAYNMMELEQTCFFSSKQLFCIKMIFFGSIDMMFVFVMILTNRMDCDLISFSLFVLVPFVISNFCYLMIFIMTRGKNPAYTYFLAGVFVGAFSSIVVSIPGFRDAANKGLWFIILLCSMIGVSLEIRHIISVLEEREVLCMN